MCRMFDFRMLLKLCLPALIGLGFVGIVWVTQTLFQSGSITARGAIGIELMYLVAFWGSVVWAVVPAIRIFRRRRSLWGVLALFSSALGWYFISIGIENGAAVVYAT